MYHLLAHPKIIRLFGYYNKGSNLFLVLELGNSNLRQLLESYSSQKLPLEKAIVFALHLSEAVMFLHGRNIVHLDIKSSNVIICDGEVAKITDLGTARKLLATATQSTLGKSGRGRYHLILLSIQTVFTSLSVIAHFYGVSSLAVHNGWRLRTGAKKRISTKISIVKNLLIYIPLQWCCGS